MGAIFFARWFCPCGQCRHQKVFKKKTHGCSFQCCKTTNPTGTLRNLPKPSGTNFPEPSGTCLRNPHQHTPELSGTFRNLPPEPTPAHTGTLRNLAELPKGTYTSTHRNSPEPASGTYTSTHTPELSTTVWNLPPKPTPSPGTLRHPLEHTRELSGTFPNLPPEPSGTFLRNLPPEPAPATRTGTHRSLSGLKTPLAYAVGENYPNPKSLSATFFRTKDSSRIPQATGLASHHGFLTRNNHAALAQLLAGLTGIKIRLLTCMFVAHPAFYRDQTSISKTSRAAKSIVPLGCGIWWLPHHLNHLGGGKNVWAFLVVGINVMLAAARVRKVIEVLKYSQEVQEFVCLEECRDVIEWLHSA